MLNFWITAFAVFCAVGVGDVIWTLWVNAITEKKKWIAALTSGLIISLGSFTTVNYVNDHKLIPAAILGAMVGTLTVMTWRERKDASQRNQLPTNDAGTVAQVGVGGLKVGEAVSTSAQGTVEASGSESQQG